LYNKYEQILSIIEGDTDQSVTDTNL